MRAERGSVSIPLVAGVLLFCLSALAAADLGSMLHARARAQSAADAAALAAALEQVAILGGDEDPVAVARAMAEANGADLLDCVCQPGAFTATVRVQTRPALTLLTGWAGRRVRATASARVDDAVGSYRSGG